MKKRLLLLLALTAMLVTACGGPQGDLYKPSKVKKVVKESVPSEKYKFIGVEEVPDAEVSTEIYTFRSKERDLEFTAINTRRIVMFGSNLYGKAVYVNYVEDVHSLYEPEAQAILDHSGIVNENNNLIISSQGELNDLTETLIQIDDLYKKEAKYNSKEWMEKHPLDRFSIDYRPIEQEKNTFSDDICGLPINGSWDKDSLYEFLSFSYASKIKEGLFEDPAVSSDFLEKGHVSLIKDFYVNGINIPKTAFADANTRMLTNNSERMYYAGYCYALGEYVIPINVGLTDENYAPQILETICDALSISYSIEYKKGIVSWNDNGTNWKVLAKNDSDNLITSVKFTKNGKTMDIPYVTYDDWTSPIHGTYLIGIRISDFADMFGLMVLVDEENGIITLNKTL